MKTKGEQHYLWRAVDQDGEVVDVLLQTRRDAAAAKRFFKRLLKSHGGEPRKIVTDKLRSYGVAHRQLMPDVVHDTSQYANNRAELSHQPTRGKRAGHAAVQIGWSSAAIPGRTGGGFQPFQSGTARGAG